MNQYPVRFGICYAIIGAQAIASVALFFVLMFTPVTPVAHKADIRNALGATDQKALVREAEQYIAQQAQQAQVTVTSQKVTGVTHPDPSTVVVTVKVRTLEIGSPSIRVTFHKGIYTISGASAG